MVLIFIISKNRLIFDCKTGNAENILSDIKKVGDKK